ncbi:hypothetical protein K435DRAFT_782113 [Dendrothele bispora CBS 962.96]|uniref:Uncharacterized protein n=1 Tax=Dendrothele bispora (strain CBS 962.96) TaxID=1314807 RepID=A0A4S8LGN8_DENBC|nr:hypothetical protein K435DRAFT_782113 [Dendrothele bispora CBS 962.96]
MGILPSTSVGFQESSKTTIFIAELSGMIPVLISVKYPEDNDLQAGSIARVRD